MSLKSFREKVNIKIYDSKEKVLLIARIIIFFVSLLAIGTMAYYFGFPQTEQTKSVSLGIIKASFVLYILNYILRFFYNFKPLDFLKRTWFEGLIMFLLFAEGISYTLTGTMILPGLFEKMGVDNTEHLYTFFIQGYFLVAVIIELASTSKILPNFRIHPSKIFILSFLVLILAGTALLMMPEMTTVKGSMSMLNALFTSTSATCVTGLIVENTETFFTAKGHFIIIILMKLGGLNVIAFGSFIALASKLGMGIKQHSVLEDFVNRESPLSATSMLGRVIRWSIGIEIIGSVLMFFFWADNVEFASTGDKIFHSIFHSVSAFNNAGFSTFTDGLYNQALRSNYAIHNLISIMVFFGGLGFIALFDIFSFSNLKERIQKKWKHFRLGTKIALYFSLFFVALGFILFYALEKDNALSGMGLSGWFSSSLMQSVTTRTAGFNTVDIGNLAIPSLVLMLILMFIGASSSSTGGGIKTSTVAMLWAAIISEIRGKKNIELFKRTISQRLVSRAFAVLIFSLAANALGIFLLTVTEGELLKQEGITIMDIIFEHVSAFSTVGLSTGITSQLSEAGRIILIFSMFIGRIGTLTIAFAVGKQVISTGYKYPEGRTVVG